MTRPAYANEAARAGKPTTILFVNLYTEMGGNEVAVLNLAKSLDPSRFTPVMMFNRRGPFVEQAEACGVRTVIIGYQSVMLQRLIFPSVCWNTMKASRALYQYLKKEEIDIIQCSDVLTLVLLFLPNLRLRIPVVYTVVFYYEWLRVLLFNLLALCMVDRIIANSGSVMEDLDARSFFLKKKMSVITNGVDTALFHPREKNERDILREELGESPSVKIVGMVARFDPVKGHVTFLEAAAAILRQRPDVRFVVIGGMLMSDTLPSWVRYREHILALHRQSGLGDRVRFLGHREDIHALTRNLDVCVCPSTREAFGLVVPEAVASGVPVVVSRGVGALEVVNGEEGVYIAEPGDPASFTRGISEALADVDARSRRPRLPSARFLENISWKNYGNKFERTYEAVRKMNV